MKNTIDALSIVSEELKNPAVSFLLEPLSNHHYGTYIHSIHVAFIAVQVGILSDLSDEDLGIIATGSVLHDIGKLYIPSSILDKKSPLTEEEFNHIKEHPESGYNILRANNFSEDISQIALLHHLKLNKTGYPTNSNNSEARNLIEKPISNIVQIVQVADMFEAIVTTRAYKKKYDIKKAIELLEKDVNLGVLEYQYVAKVSELLQNNQLLLQTI